MAYDLTFETLHIYDTGQAGITVPVTMRYGQLYTIMTAKVDTGASCCIFRRVYGEELGLTIEDGYRQTIHTAAGSFLTYGQEITLSVLDFDFDALVYFAAEDAFSRNVLGRQDWLNRMRVGLMDFEGKLYLSRYEA